MSSLAPTLHNYIHEPSIGGRANATEWAKTIKGLIQALDYGSREDSTTASTILHDSVLRIETREPWRQVDAQFGYCFKDVVPTEVRMYLCDNPGLRITATLGADGLAQQAILECTAQDGHWHGYLQDGIQNAIPLTLALARFVDHVAINQI